ncbi:MAG: hypothetical protein ACTHN5_06240 [Phycisphaerae bacterium]
MQGTAPETPGGGHGPSAFDAAIDACLKQIEQSPADVELHKALRDVALRRKSAGGKPAGGFLGPTLPYPGKTDKEKMLNAEYVLAHDPANIPAMMDLYRAAESARYPDVAEWIGQLLKEATRTTKPR